MAVAAGWIGTGLVGEAVGAEAAISSSLATPVWYWSVAEAPSAAGSEESLRALVMDVLCLRWLGSGVEGAVALWWDRLGSGTKRLFRVLASVRCVGPVRSAGGSGAVRARSRSRRRSMVISSLGPSGRHGRPNSVKIKSRYFAGFCGLKHVPCM